MKREISKAPIKQNQIAKLVPYAAWTYLIGMLGYLVVLAVKAALAGEMVLVLIDLFAILTAVWYFGGSLLAIPMGLAFNQGFRPDRVPSLHSMHWRVLNYWNILPLRKNITWATVTGNFALTLSAMGRYQDAEATLRRGVAVIEKSRRWQRNFIGALLVNNLSYIVYKQKRFDEAEELCLRALEICQNSGNSGKAFSAFPLLSRSLIEVARGNIDDAKKYLAESIEILESNEHSWAIIRDSLLTARTNAYLTAIVIQLKQGDTAAAQHVWEKIAEEQAGGSMRFSIGSMAILVDAAQQFEKLGDFYKADLTLQTAYSIGREIPDNPDSLHVQDSFQKLLEVSGRGDEVADMRRWIMPASPELTGQTQIGLQP